VRVAIVVASEGVLPVRAVNMIRPRLVWVGWLRSRDGSWQNNFARSTQTERASGGLLGAAKRAIAGAGGGCQSCELELMFDIVTL
jgi:hypothetical protein